MEGLITTLLVFASLGAIYLCMWWPSRYVHDLKRAQETIAVLSVLLLLAVGPRVLAFIAWAG